MRNSLLASSAVTALFVLISQSAYSQIIINPPGSGGGGTVSVTSASPNIIINPTPGTGTFTVGATYPINAQTGTSYTVLSTDAGKLVTFSNASAIAVTLPQATGSFAAGFSFDVQNVGAGTVTITPTTSTINGAATRVLPANTGCSITSDGTNYQVSACANIATTSLFGSVKPDGTSITVSGGVISAPGAGGGTVVTSGSPANGNLTKFTGATTISNADLTGDVTTSGGVATTLANSGVSAATYGSATQAPVIAIDVKGRATTASNVTITPAIGSVTGLGTGVGTALGNNLSAAGGVTTTVVSGTSALGTSAIGSAACATVVTTTATNAATTDTMLAGFNGDPTGVVGYQPLVAGMLTIISYPSSGNVNFKVCNNTNASITPGAITLNWRILR